MIFRFGFVSNAMSLWDASPAKTLTFARYSKLSKTERKEALLTVTKANLHNTMRTLHYIIGHGIPLYRFSSSIVPLATHPDVMWDFVTPFQKSFGRLESLLKPINCEQAFIQINSLCLRARRNPSQKCGNRYGVSLPHA